MCLFYAKSHSFSPSHLQPLPSSSLTQNNKMGRNFKQPTFDNNPEKKSEKYGVYRLIKTPG